MRCVDPARLAGVDIGALGLSGADQPVHGDQGHQPGLQVGLSEAAGPQRLHPMGGGFPGGRQGLGSNETDIAVAARLAPGPAVVDLQHVKALTEQQLVLPLGRLVARLEQARRGSHAASRLHGSEAGGADQALQPLVGEVGTGQQGAGVGLHP